MFDVEIPVPHGADSLASIGRCLGAAGVGLEGGGMWSGVAHYLVDAAHADVAAEALTAAGFGPVAVRRAVIAELDADVPGALGAMMRKISEAGAFLLCQYSDHRNRKVLIADNADSLQAALEPAGLS